MKIRINLRCAQLQAGTGVSITGPHSGKQILKTNTTALESRISALESDVSDLQSEFAALDTAVATLQTDVATAQTTADNAAAAAAAAQAEIDGYGSEILETCTGTITVLTP